MASQISQLIPDGLDLPYKQPDTSIFLNPFDSPALLSYYHELAKWHGFVRFLGLPQLKDNPDVPLTSLFVEPWLTSSAVVLQTNLQGLQGRGSDPLSAIVSNPRLVILGDPGSGKSTLISWITLQLSATMGAPFQDRLGNLVPLPMILRDLDLGNRLTWDRLLGAFLRHPVAKDLNASTSHDLLERGQAFPLLDGLDEIGNIPIRQMLRKAIIEGARRYPRCRFLLTSRVVGYDELPFDRLLPEELQRRHASTGKPSSRSGESNSGVSVLYVAPFSDQQVQQFAQNWYKQREASESLREQGVKDLVGAIRGSETTLSLARNPILLTLMALIHRVERILPHGRVLLFEKITAAYLESIDTFRGLGGAAEFSLPKKKRWLAEVAFQMQLRRLSKYRSQERAKKQLSETGDVSATESEVLAWLRRAMQGGPAGNQELAQRFLDYIGRRSGLLLPRGEGIFAFVHLSFQEYFAAWHIAESVSTRAWIGGHPSPELAPRDLAGYAREPSFREVFILLFELLADRGDWGEVMAEVLFGNDFEKIRKGGPEEEPRALLLAAISADPYTSWSRSLQTGAWRACWDWELKREHDLLRMKLLFNNESPLSKILFGCSDPRAGWPTLLEVATYYPVERLDLSNIEQIDFAPLAQLQPLKSLSLSNTGIVDLSPLANLTSLQWLDLRGTQVIDLKPLSNLEHLEWLSLNGTPVRDVSPLSGLRSLQTLHLARTAVEDVSALASLPLLQHLNISGTRISSISALSRNLRNLTVTR